MLRKTFSLLIFLVFSWLIYCMITLPNLEGLGNKTRKPSISIFDKNNNYVGSLGDVYAGIIEYEDISKHLVDAVIVLEDRRFFEHYGVDLRGLVRAMLQNLKELRYSQGASTITQQLSKLIFLNSEKTLSRKIRELMIAFYLEYKFTKNEILTMYLNRAYFGSGQYGIKAASKRFFLKEPKDLSIAEASILAGSLKAPSRLALTVNKEASISRARTVLKLLNRNNLISLRILENSEKELNNIKNKNYFFDENIRYYIDWLHASTPDEVLNNKKDLIITSTLDPQIQKTINFSLKKNTNKLDNNIQSAVVVMNFDGAVKGMLGGRRWSESKFNRATQSKRQLGSVFKTYVYLTALDMGFNLTDKIMDTPIKKGEWSPKNFSNKYEGLISLKKAFATSSNVAAIRLSDLVGRENIIKQVKKFGITSKVLNNPSMALGTSSFSLLETVGSFGAICGRGMPVIPFGINEIKLRDNRSIWKRNLPERNKVVSNQVLIKLKKLLRSVVKEGTGKRIAKVPIDIIGKTGTSQKNRDAWFLGCAKKHVIGVWVGRDDDKSMKNIYGSTLPLSIFKDIVLNL